MSGGGYLRVFDDVAAGFVGGSRDYNSERACATDALFVTCGVESEATLRSTRLEAEASPYDRSSR